MSTKKKTTIKLTKLSSVRKGSQRVTLKNGNEGSVKFKYIIYKHSVWVTNIAVLLFSVYMLFIPIRQLQLWNKIYWPASHLLNWQSIFIKAKSSWKCRQLYCATTELIRRPVYLYEPYTHLNKQELWYTSQTEQVETWCTV